MKFSSVVVFACLVSLLHARTINVADHGIVPGQDVTRAVNDLVKSISAEEGVTLYFPEGNTISTSRMPPRSIAPWPTTIMGSSAWPFLFSVTRT